MQIELIIYKRFSISFKIKIQFNRKTLFFFFLTLSSIKCIDPTVLSIIMAIYIIRPTYIRMKLHIDVECYLAVFVVKVDDFRFKIPDLNHLIRIYF